MGLLEFVFGKSAPKDDTASKEAFYLNDDDAKTFGNIDYMRSNKVVRRTFAKKKGQEHLESIRQVSSLGAKSVDGNGGFSASSSTASSSAPTASTPSSSSVPKSTRRKPASSDMDTFRNMARDMRK